MKNTQLPPAPENKTLPCPMFQGEMVNTTRRESTRKVDFVMIRVYEGTFCFTDLTLITYSIPCALATQPSTQSLITHLVDPIVTKVTPERYLMRDETISPKKRAVTILALEWASIGWLALCDNSLSSFSSHWY